MQRSFIYLPGSSPPDKNAVNAHDIMRDVIVKTADNLAITGWFRPSQDGLPTLVFFHGNTGDISDRFFKMRAPIAQGYGVLMVESRG